MDEDYGIGHYDRSGKRITLMQWAALFEQLEYRRVRSTMTASGARVSTVWLGLDHGWGDGPPVIFESMVFLAGKDIDQDRYATEADAIAGHDALVTQYGGAVPGAPPPGGRMNG